MDGGDISAYAQNARCLDWTCSFLLDMFFFLVLRRYLDDFSTVPDGPVAMHAWQLPIHSHMGMKGYCEADVAVMLCQLIAVRGMRTDPSLGGVELLTMTAPTPPLVDTELDNVCPSKFTSLSGGVGTHGVFAVKGWTRSLCCVAVLYAFFDKPELFQARLAFDPTVFNFHSFQCTDFYIVLTVQGVSDTAKEYRA